MEEELQHSVMISEAGGDVDMDDASVDNRGAHLPGDGTVVDGIDREVLENDGIVAEDEDDAMDMDDDDEDEDEDGGSGQGDEESEGDEDDEDDEDREDGEEDEDGVFEEDAEEDDEDEAANEAPVARRGSPDAEDDQADEEEDDEGVGAVKIKPGETDESDDSDISNARSGSDAESEEDAAWDEGAENGDEDEDEESDNAISNQCMFCKEDEENDPGEDFETYLACAGCGGNGQRLPPSGTRGWDVVLANYVDNLQHTNTAPGRTKPSTRKPVRALCSVLFWSLLHKASLLTLRSTQKLEMSRLRGAGCLRRRRH